ncbi:MAG: phosphate signaling complex protein PhoU [Candidatus Promineifilaceae bacterium]
MPIPSRSILDQEFKKLHEDLLRLAGMVDEAINLGVIAFLDCNFELAQQVINHDRQVNLLRYEIEQRCLQILATQQPAAGDLRHVLAAIHITIELERVGDHAAGIATLAQRLGNREEMLSFHQLPKMAARARKMLHDSMDAFMQRDAEAAAHVIKYDDKLDKNYTKLFRHTLQDMQNDAYIRSATYLLWAGHSLERIGDRATNIAERVIFMVTGKYAELEKFYAYDLEDTEDDGLG